MSQQRIKLTRGGYKKIKTELEHLMTKKRREIAQDLKEARAHGDLKENAEYDAAKNAQAFNEKKISELSSKLERSEILSDDIADDRVLLGATVTLQDIDREETIIYQLVAAEEADFKENKLSVTSPVGKSLLGGKIKDIVKINVPAGVLQYKILKIER
jgi:transcription elongation factor GreA